MVVRVREEKVLLRNLPELSTAERRSLETDQGLEADDPPRSRADMGAVLKIRALHTPPQHTQYICPCPRRKLTRKPEKELP